jgi:probable rRNA maturation factor
VAQVLFHYADRQLLLNHKRKIQSFIKQIFAREKVPFIRLDYVFASDDFVLQVNQSHLKHDFYTDIITFGLSEKGEPVAGEVYISVDRVKDNAATFHTLFEEEMLRVLFHGALHLCGYKDKKKVDIALMRKKEDTYIRQFKNL